MDWLLITLAFAVSCASHYWVFVMSRDIGRCQERLRNIHAEYRLRMAMRVLVAHWFCEKSEPADYLKTGFSGPIAKTYEVVPGCVVVDTNAKDEVVGVEMIWPPCELDGED